jgi:uncharacterized 2Fe-2S/4Fe-4S cluster protein (DUF4445 family)
VERPVDGYQVATVSITYGNEQKEIAVASGTVLGEAIAATGLPLEQPCAGRGTCGLCKLLAEGELAPLDKVELSLLAPSEQAAGYRLACRARVLGDVDVTLAPIVVYSDKIFRVCDDYRRSAGPLGLAIDLGSTTVAAFLTMLDGGQVCMGAATLNQQTVFGADVISRLAAARQGPEKAERLSNLALASIVQAVTALKLPGRVQARIRKATVVGNPAMHHLLLRLPVETLAVLPFQPYSLDPLRMTAGLFADLFPPGTEVVLPPLIGGFVGSDALSCLAYFGFDSPPGPMLAIDLGTNGEVMVTDGQRILVTSTAAGPAFEGVNISCGSRAVDGAITAVRLAGDELVMETIGAEPPVGLTGSGLLSAVYELLQAGLIETSGRMATAPPRLSERIGRDARGVRRLALSAEQGIYLTQRDVRELQKAKGAIRAAADTLLHDLELQPGDLERVILTGSFGGQVDVDAALGMGMIPPVRREVVEHFANGAGFGAALFLDDEGFALGERLAARARQVELDLDAGFNERFIRDMALAEDSGIK